MTKETKISGLSFHLIATVTLLVLLFFAFADLSEWFMIAVRKDLSAYPFNGEGPAPYYYRTPQLYSTVCLTWGLVFLGLLFLGLRTMLKKEHKKMLIVSGLTVIAVAARFIHGQIGLN